MKNLDLPKEDILKCFHCGNETLMRQMGEYKWDSNENLFLSYTYKMFACPVCHKITLIKTYWDEYMIEYKPKVGFHTKDTIF